MTQLNPEPKGSPLDGAKFRSGNQTDFLNRLKNITTQLYNERRSYEDTWRDISWFIAPMRGRFWNQQTPNSYWRGMFRGSQILDTTARDACETLGSFLLASICSPATPWFKLTASKPADEENPDIAKWLSLVENRMQQVLAESNFYHAMGELFLDLAAFGTGILIPREDDETFVRFYPVTCGEGYLQQNDKRQVDSLYRRYLQTAKQIVDRFGFENCPESVQNNIESNIDPLEYIVWDCILPNPYFIKGAYGWKGFKYIDCTFMETGTDGKSFLSAKGWDTKPFIAARWQTIANEVYGRGPGENALPDAKSAQILKLRIMEAVDKSVRPPLMADSSMQGGQIQMTPGAVNFVPGLSNSGSAGGGIRPLVNANFDSRGTAEELQDTRTQIKTTLKNDLILNITSMQGTPATATEINARQQEKLQVLGPMLNRFEGEALNPIIQFVLKVMKRRGLLPKPPQGITLDTMNVVYTSPLFRAQKVTETTAIEQSLDFAGKMAQANPAVLDNFDFDFIMREYGQLLSIDPRCFKDPQDVAQQRQQQQQAQQQQQQLQAAQQQAQTAVQASQAGKNISDINVGGGMNAAEMMAQGG